MYASSAAELVTEIIQYVDRKIELKPIEIESLYGGIMVDTKNLRGQAEMKLCWALPTPESLRN